MKNFICDDHHDMRYLLSYILEETGRKSVIIPDRKHLFARSSLGMDLILRNLWFEEDDGIDLLISWIYECPVILITGVQNPDLNGKEKALGFIDIIRKPCDPLEVMTHSQSVNHL